MIIPESAKVYGNLEIWTEASITSAGVGSFNSVEVGTDGVKFPNDAFGGGGDTAGMRLVNKGGEAQSLEVYVTNDADDWVNLSVPDVNAAKVNGNTIWNAGNFNPATKSDVGHIHDDRYYTESETNSLLAGKSDVGHTHDDRYYTETETNSLLSTKSNVGHLHDDRYLKLSDGFGGTDQYSFTLESGSNTGGLCLNLRDDNDGSEYFVVRNNAGAQSLLAKSDSTVNIGYQNYTSLKPTLEIGDGQYGLAAEAGHLNLIASSGLVNIYSRSGSNNAVLQGTVWHSGNLTPANYSLTGHSHNVTDLAWSTNQYNDVLGFSKNGIIDSTGGNGIYGSWSYNLKMLHSSNPNLWQFVLAADFFTDSIGFRRKTDVAGTGVWQDSRYLWHTGNFNPANYSLTGHTHSILDIGDRTTGYFDDNYDVGTAKYLRWKNYGDSHMIIDASMGTAPNGATISRTNPDVMWAETYPTLMGWNGSNTYGVRVDRSRYADNADNLGGVPLSRIVYGQNDSATTQNSGLFGDITKSGFYNNNTSTDSPVASTWAHVIHSDYTGDNGWAWQLAANFEAENSEDYYTRIKASNTWKDWRKIWTTKDITQTNINNWNSAYDNVHSHSNKSNLDTINQNLGTSYSPTFAGLTVGNVSPTEFSYLDGVTSNIQTQLNNLSSSVPRYYALGQYSITTVTSDWTSITTYKPTLTFTGLTNGAPKRARYQFIGDCYNCGYIAIKIGTELLSGADQIIPLDGVIPAINSDLTTTSHIDIEFCLVPQSSNATGYLIVTLTHGTATSKKMVSFNYYTMSQTHNSGSETVDVMIKSNGTNGSYSPNETFGIVEC